MQLKYQVACILNNWVHYDMPYKMYINIQPKMGSVYPEKEIFLFLKSPVELRIVEP